MPTTLTLKCDFCSASFQRELRVQAACQASFCSLKCYGLARRAKRQVQCDHCHTMFLKLPNQIKKTHHHFCSKSCAAIYHNAHKRQGKRRSKLEIWLEQKLQSLYPNLCIFNDKKTIGSELDIYAPSLNLAFELNGIFHYEPIYGQEKLASIQTNDKRKFQACLEHGIELCIIDSSSMKNFKEPKAHKYLDIITSVIESKLLTVSPS